MASIDFAETEVKTTSTGIELTEAAAVRVRALLEERNLEGHALRVFVQGGGCSGFQYGMALEGEPRESDLRFSLHGVDLVVDPQSMAYLSGARIDYIDDVMGSGFNVENPNAVASCGCGHSFRTADSGAPGGSHGGC